MREFRPRHLGYSDSQRNESSYGPVPVDERVYLLLKALMDIVLAVNESLATWEEGGAKQGSTSLESAPHLWVSDEAWLSHFSTQSELDLAQSSLIPNTLMTWKDLPYPKYLNDMLATSLLFHRIYSGTEILPPNLARHVQQADVWLIRMLLLASAANLSLFWLDTTPWRWLPIGILVATVAQILRWIWVQTLATNLRARMLGCYKTPIFWISQRILRKRLVLLLTQPFGGPYAYLKKVRENGDAAARISSLFRLPPIITTIFLFLPLATWAANLVPMITGRWSVALPLGAAAMSLIAAFFFFCYTKFPCTVRSIFSNSLPISGCFAILPTPFAGCTGDDARRDKGSLGNLQASKYNRGIKLTS